MTVRSYLLSYKYNIDRSRAFPCQTESSATVDSIPAGQRHADRERDQRRRGDDRVPQPGGDEEEPRGGAVSRRVPVDAEPREPGRGDRRGDDAGEGEQRERQEPAGRRLDDRWSAGDAGGIENHARVLAGRVKRFVVARTGDRADHTI